MDVAITGATGLIGSALATSLRADGHRVLRLRRGGVTEGNDIGWDPAAGRIDAPALEHVDAVVHLAGEGIGEQRWSDEQKRKIRESRVRGTSVLAGAIASREHKPRVFVSASAIGYYGDRGDEVLTEKSASGSDFLAEVCRAWEGETQTAADAGVRTVIVRNGIVLDKDGGALARMLLPFRLGIGGKQGSGKQWMSWIALVDVVAAIRAVIDDERFRGPVNLTAPNPVTNHEFARTLGRVLHRPTVLPTPMLPLKLRYGAELVESLLLVSQRVLPNELDANGFRFTAPVLEGALEAILRAVTRLWIDTDIGDDPDDTVALWCAARAPGVELVGVSTVDGDVAQRAALVRELLPEVAAYAGPPDPEQLRTVDALVGIGPWTNVAQIAEAGGLPRRVVVMGGALGRVQHHGNWHEVEHNVGRDPAAARQLLASTGDLVIVPLDATAPLTVDEDMEGSLASAIPLLESQLSAWRNRHGRHVPLVLHDPAAVLIALGEPLARMESRRLHLDEEGVMRASTTGPSHHVVAHIDADATRARVCALVSGG